MTAPYISDLIHIRNYVVQATNNFALSKTTFKDLSKMLVVLDKKIVEQILSDEFKDIVGFGDAETVMREAAANNNIKTGMKSANNSIVPAVSVMAGKTQHLKPEPV